MRRATLQHRKTALEQLAQLNKDLRQYWSSLLMDTSCNDLTPRMPLYRFNAHLNLMYHLIFVFVGRSFIVKSPRSQHSPSIPLRNDLVTDCLSSAKALIDLCQNLHDNIGLARCSYTEFTSCCAALVAILAQRISTEEPSLKTPCDKGVKLLKEMSAGNLSRASERQTIDALEMAARKLDEKNNANATTAPGGTYSQYLAWASGQSERSVSSPDQRWYASSQALAGTSDVSWTNSGSAGNGQSAVSGLQANHEGGTFSFDDFEIGDLADVPGLAPWFDFGLQ